MLTPDEKERFRRQIMIGEMGHAGQLKLKRARVLIAGAGGLGSPAAVYLAAAGVGTLGIVDHDRVALSNLNRQILHWEEDIGKPKSESASRKLQRLNSATRVEAMAETLSSANVSGIVAGFDVVIDALDNVPTRLLLNRAAIEHRVPLIHGAVDGFGGRVLTIIRGRGACLQCMHKGPVPAETIPVIGVAPAVIGGIQATEAIKYITGIGDLLAGRLLIYDGIGLTFNEFKVKRDPNCEACGSPQP
jgi:adenylyltransferase/sulfurtransferase